VKNSSIEDNENLYIRVVFFYLNNTTWRIANKMFTPPGVCGQ